MRIEAVGLMEADMTDTDSSVPDAEFQGEVRLLQLGVPLPMLGGRKLGLEGAKAIINNFADGDEDLLVTFNCPGEEPLVFKALAMRAYGDSLQALIRAESKEEMARFMGLTADHAPGGMEVEMELHGDPVTGEIPDPVEAARIRSVRVELVPKH